MKYFEKQSSMFIIVSLMLCLNNITHQENCKNLKKFCGKPLVSWVITALNNSKLVDEIIIAESNTLEAVEEVERKYWRNKRSVSVYPDASGGNRQTARGESDLDIFRDAGYKRLKYKSKKTLILKC